MKIKIEDYHPCEDGKKWYDSQPDFGTAWRECPRGDWMLWVAIKLGIEEKLLFKAAALSASTVLHLMRDNRSKQAVQAVLDYADGKISRGELRVFADAAEAAAAAAAAVAAYAAAVAAYAVASSSYAAGYAAAVAGYAATEAAAAAVAASEAGGYAAARAENERKTAEICREILTESVFEKVKNI